MESTTTKDIILQTAASLFAKKSFSATSIREISRACDVNISAINYHFETKENLFHQAVADQYKMVEKEILDLFQKNLSFEKFSIKVLRLFTRESTMLLSTYKMFLTDEFQNMNKQGHTFSSNLGLRVKTFLKVF